MTEVPAAAELYTQKQLKWQMLGDGSTGKMLGMQAPELSLAPRTHVKARSRDMHLKFQCWGGRVRKGPGTHWPLRGSVRDHLRGQHGEKTGEDPPV